MLLPPEFGVTRAGRPRPDTHADGANANIRQLRAAGQATAAFAVLRRCRLPTVRSRPMLDGGQGSVVRRDSTSRRCGSSWACWSMNCGSCGFEIQSGFAFCPKCGARQPYLCTGCGYACSPDFAFCPRCGAQVDGAAKLDNRPQSPRIELPASSRQAEPPVFPTVASGRAPRRASQGPRPKPIAALSRCCLPTSAASPTLSEQLDPELMRTLQNELFEELTAAVQHFGGFVDKFIGDALLALFGAPVAHEDDPERALRAALDMIVRTARLGERSAAYAGSPADASYRHQYGTGRDRWLWRGQQQILFGDRRHGEYRATIAVDGRAGRGAGRTAHVPVDPARVRIRVARRRGAARQGRQRSGAPADRTA